VVDQCDLGNPFNISRNIWNVLEESVELVSYKKPSYLDFLCVCGVEEALVSLKKISEWNVSCIVF
jgi:hypothetical protein